ncbi:hypothetical protein HU200_055640 [Digitaria exilis]|uniref:Bet v I/Major latex protein domain-containing protein n=1 Tax=Digitaria exilis TaxID=1010633 RepID=A0A835E5T3_9POAL|nr:hypothetical protein HU200_055640 [Digitaria exilis]
MVAGSIKEELAIAVPAEMLWKAAFATGDESSLRNLFAGLSNAEVKIDGDGEPGSIYSLKFNPGVGAGTVFIKGRLAARDNEAQVISFNEVTIEGGEMAAAQLKSQVVKCKVEPAVAGGCVAKVTIEYESLNGRPLSPVDEAKLMKGYVGLMKKMEENMVAYS